MNLTTTLYATSINQVIEQLDAIIDWSKHNQSRIGYFATLYRKMTIAVKEGIANNRFENGHRMEALDIIFANRYLHAFDAYVNKKPCTNAWCVAFDAASKTNLIVLQHLVLGINTHINLDLGIAAAEACPGQEIHGLKGDFEKINDVIAALTQSVQDDLSEVWPPLKLLASIANHHQEAVLNFSINTARKASWANAVALSAMTGLVKESYIKVMDETVVVLAHRIMSPGLAVQLILSPVLHKENKHVSEIIEMLN